MYWEGGKKEGKERGREGEREGESINITRFHHHHPRARKAGEEGQPAPIWEGKKIYLQEISAIGITNSLLRTRL